MQSEPVIIGFTGTRVGMTAKQKATVYELIHEYIISEIHHGDCTGADAEFHYLVTKFLPSVRVCVHPPINVRHRAYCEPRGCDTVMEPKDYLVRNRDIVKSADIIIGAPLSLIKKGGTWYTLKHSLNAGKPTIVVDSNGKLSKYNFPDGSNVGTLF